MKTCIIIVNCNDFSHTKHLIENIKNYKILDEIVIVDNNSNIEEKELLKKLEKVNIHLIYNDSNLGYSRGINIGAKYLIEKYNKCNIFISNSDIVIFSEQDLIKMVDALTQKNVGVVGPTILERGIKLKGRKDVSLSKDYMIDMPILKHFTNEDTNVYPNDYYKNDLTKVDIISSCFFLMKSEVLEKINFMDEGVFLYYEDNILCKKIRNIGLDVLILNNVNIKHLFGTSIDKIKKNIEKRALFYQSKYYYHKNYNNVSFLDHLILMKFDNYK